MRRRPVPAQYASHCALRRRERGLHPPPEIACRASRCASSTSDSVATNANRRSRRGWPAYRPARAGSTSARRRTAAARAAAAAGRPANSRRRSPGPNTSWRPSRRNASAMCAGLMPGMSVPMITTGPGGCAVEDALHAPGRDRRPLRHARDAARPMPARASRRRAQRQAWSAIADRTRRAQQRRAALPRKARRAGDADLARQPRLDAPATGALAMITSRQRKGAARRRGALRLSLRQRAGHEHRAGVVSGVLTGTKT